jgi:FkbM family methyltransferase
MSLKSSILEIYKHLPFELAVALSRWKPSLALYIPPAGRDLVIDDYLGMFKVQIDTYSDVERCMLSRTYEPATVAIVNKFVRPGQVCLDIGANVGAITLAMVKAVGETGRVEAFEPGSRFIERLRKNLEMNPAVAGRVHAHQLGLSDEPGELLWQESRNAPGNASIHWIDPSRPSARVNVTTLDAFVLEQGLSAVHFLKIDVEGMERRVLAGGLETIRRDRPVIYFESSLSDDEQKQAGQAIEDMLTSIGYRLYKIVDNKGRIRPTQYPDFSFNTIAIPEDGEYPRK